MSDTPDENVNDDTTRDPAEGPAEDTTYGWDEAVDEAPSENAALVAAAAESAEKIETILRGVRTHAQTVPATREMEAVLSALAGLARTSMPASSDPDELEEWAERVEFAPLPDGSEGDTLSEWRFTVSDAIKPIFDPPA